VCTLAVAGFSRNVAAAVMWEVGFIDAVDSQCINCFIMFFFFFALSFFTYVTKKSSLKCIENALEVYLRS